MAQPDRARAILKLRHEPRAGGLRMENLEQRLAPAGLALVAVVAIASSEGGYFPTSWGWSAPALLGVIATGRWRVEGPIGVGLTQRF